MRTFSFGGGVQSTAVLALAAAGEVQYDAYLFCNVGDRAEHPDTLDFVHTVAMPYAAAHGIDLVELRRTRRDGTTEDLYDRLTREGSRSLPIPVRMNTTGAPGTRSCTADFKIRVVARWQREHGATPENPAVCGIGISLDEVHRMRTDSGIPHQVLEYPLLDLRLRREDCRRVITDAGLPMPPKSACYFCPFHTPAMWRDMRHTRPDLFDKAADLEDTLNDRRRMRGKDPVWLSGALIPLRRAYGRDDPTLFDEPQDIPCDTGMCWV